MSKLYGFPPEVIANMSNGQKEMYLSDGSDPRTGAPVMTFSTQAEARAYQASLRGK